MGPTTQHKPGPWEPSPAEAMDDLPYHSSLHVFWRGAVGMSESVLVTEEGTERLA